MQQAIELFPNDEVLAFNVGEIFFNQGEAIKAIDYYKLATTIKEDWAPPYRQLGYAYLNKGEYQLAIDSLKKFMELAPDDPQALTIESLIPKLEEMVKKDWIWKVSLRSAQIFNAATSLVYPLLKGFPYNLFLFGPANAACSFILTSNDSQ